LALPIARCSLFSRFYKAVVVRNPGVVAGIKEMMKRGQPYLGAFLPKDENTDSNVITDINSVQEVGVFAVGRGEDDKEEGFTAVLYPPSSNKNHRTGQSWSNADRRSPTTNSRTSYTPAFSITFRTTHR
jgi:ATP-dependent Lon protease